MDKDIATIKATPWAADPLADLARQAQAMGDAYKLAEVMCRTSMVPKQYQGKPDDGAAAILYGAELGMNAIQSMQNVMVINGKPGIEARTMVALLKTKGYRFTTEEQSDERVTITGTAPNGDTETSTWDIARARKAGFTSNKLYEKIPGQMLFAKAATEVCRRLAPDVLLGISHTTEDLRLMSPVIEQAKATRVDRPAGGAEGVRAALEAKAKPGADDDAVQRALAAIDRAPTMPALYRIVSHAATLGLGEQDMADIHAAADERRYEISDAQHEADIEAREEGE